MRNSESPPRFRKINSSLIFSDKHPSLLLLRSASGSGQLKSECHYSALSETICGGSYHSTSVPQTQGKAGSSAVRRESSPDSVCSSTLEKARRTRGSANISGLKSRHGQFPR